MGPLTLDDLIRVLSEANQEIGALRGAINRAHERLDQIGVQHTNDGPGRATLDLRMSALLRFVESQHGAHKWTGGVSPRIGLDGKLVQPPRPAGHPCTAIEDGVLCAEGCVFCNQRKIGRSMGCTCGLVPTTWQNPEYHSTGCPMVRGGPLDPERKPSAGERA